MENIYKSSQNDFIVEEPSSPIIGSIVHFGDNDFKVTQVDCYYSNVEPFKYNYVLYMATIIPFNNILNID